MHGNTPNTANSGYYSRVQSKIDLFNHLQFYRDHNKVYP